MSKTILSLLLAFYCLNASSQNAGPLISKIAFGSCASEEHPQPVLDLVVRHKPDVFVYLGDNIYGDTKDMNVLKEKYAKLAAKPEFQRLKTW